MIDILKVTTIETNKVKCGRYVTTSYLLFKKQGSDYAFSLSSFKPFLKGHFLAPINVCLPKNIFSYYCVPLALHAMFVLPLLPPLAALFQASPLAL